MYDIQKELIDNNQEPITREDIATALQNRNLLRQTKAIQISSNIKYVSIQFQTSQLMEIFLHRTSNPKRKFSDYILT